VPRPSILTRRQLHHHPVQGLAEHDLAAQAAALVFLDRAQHTAGRTLLESIQLGDLPGVGMVMIDGIVRCGRSRSTPPAMEVPVVVQ